MKIAIVNTWSISPKAIGGTERFVMDLAEAFANNGNDVDVYMLSGNTHQQGKVNYININLFNMQGEADEYIVQKYFGNFETRESYLNLAKSLEAKINMDKYDIIQLNSLLFLDAWKDKKRIFTIHTNPFEYVLAWGEKSFEEAIRIMKEYKDSEDIKFVTPSKYYADEYSKLSKCNINFIPHAINTTRLNIDESKDYIYKYYNIDQNKVKIIVPQRLEPIQKQPQLVIEACSLLPDEIISKIEIVYSGLDKQYNKFVNALKQQAENSKLDIKILRFKYISELYKIADLCVLPSQSESFGYSALESLSLGIYTILNDIPTFNEIAHGNKYNCIFEKNSKIDLKNQILNCIKNNRYIRKVTPTNSWKRTYDIMTFEKNYMELIKLIKKKN